MRRCPHCHQQVPEGEYCTYCGKPLKPFASWQAALLVLAAALAVVLIAVPFHRYTQSRAAVQQSKDDKMLQQYYEEQARAEAEKAAEEARPDIYDLKIVSSDHDYSFGSNYGHITGTVKNTSFDKEISYFKITAKLKGRTGSVIGNDYDSFYGTLGPGESVDFDIMYKKPSSTVTDYKLEIEEVS